MSDAFASPIEERLPTPGVEAGRYWRLRLQIFRTLMHQALQEARLRTILILVLTVIFWVGMLFVFLEGFSLMRGVITHEATRAETVHAIFNVFFLSLMGMLTLSSAIILYSGLFRSRETRFLLTTPTRVSRIVWFKFQETLLFSCWGFFLLGSPLLVAYGLMDGAPWYYYAAFLPFMITFAFIPVSLGAIICLATVRFLPRLRIHALAGIVVALAVLLAAISWSIVREVNAADTMTMEWFQSTLSRLKYSEQRWFPSWWLSSGLLEAAHPAESKSQSSRVESLGFLCVLTSNAMLLYLVLGAVADRWYVAGFSSLAELGSTRKKASAGVIDRVVNLLTSPFPPAMRLLLLKDLKVFRRDILQWSQFVIFFGLLTFYFLNARRLHYGNSVSSWMMVVGYLNLGVVGLLLATFTTRFIFPLISLEGRKFWILGTLPINRWDILLSKFLFACGVSLLPCSILILLSDLMLKLGDRPWVMVLHQITCITLCFGLCGIAVGMGARLPDLREAAPAKIASGFGGTLTLVLSVLFIIATVCATAIPVCWWLQKPYVAIGEPSWLDSFRLGTWGAIMLGVAFTIAFGLFATIVPLRSGFRAFRELEP